MNTRADLKLARGRAENLQRKIPIISIVAPNSGTGKTTFIEKITRNLTAAGAKIVAVVSLKGFFLVQKTDARENFLSVTEKFEGVDLILTEGRTHAIFPRNFTLARLRRTHYRRKNCGDFFKQI